MRKVQSRSRSREREQEQAVQTLYQSTRPICEVLRFSRPYRLDLAQHSTSSSSYNGPRQGKEQITKYSLKEHALCMGRNKN